MTSTDVTIGLHSVEPGIIVVATTSAYALQGDSSRVYQVHYKGQG